MRKSIVLMIVASLLVLSSGCRVLPQVFPRYHGCDSFRDCLRSTVRRPADWCWGHCAVAEDVPDVKIDGVGQIGRK